MKVYYNVDGTIQNVTGDSIFSQSSGSNELQIKIDYPETASLETKFLVPDGLGGVVAAEPIVMEVTPDYVDGGYMWQAPSGIGAGYLENAGKAYLSVRVLYESGTKVKTTRLVQFDIEPSGDYEATPITPEQADQILALIANANGNILKLQEESDTNQIYKADAVVTGLNNNELELIVTVKDTVTVDLINKLGLNIQIKSATETTDISSVMQFNSSSNFIYITVVNESEETVIAKTRVYFPFNKVTWSSVDLVNIPSNNFLGKYTYDGTYFYASNTTYKPATTLADGLMSRSDKTLLGNKVDKNITSYPAATLSHLQEVYINDGGAAKKATLQQIKQYVVNDITNLNVRIKVTELPTENININAIYLVPLPTELTDNVYAEYYYDNLESKWELMGTTEVTLTADSVDYDNTTSGLTADTVQGAVDEVNTKANSKQPINLLFTNTAVLTTAFVADATYGDYGFRASVTLSGVVATDIPQVVFAPTEADSGNYASVAVSYAGGVYIYAKAVPSATITIPTILIQRGA